MIDAGLAFFASIGAGAAFAVVARFAFTRERRIKRALRRVRPTPIREARDGKAVKLVGELVYAGRSIPSPLSQRACAYYSIVVEEYRSRRRARRPLARDRARGERDRLLPAGRQRRGARARCQRRQGLAGAGATIARRAPRRIISAATPTSSASWASAAAPSRAAFFRKNLRAYEGVLEAGERVAVGGLARWMPDPDAAGGNYRETPKRLVLEASESLPLFLSDDPATL